MIRTYFAFCGTADEHRTVRALLRFGLERDFGLTNAVIVKDGRGKPILETGNLHISLSHSAGLCMAAAADEPIGCDVEKRPERWDDEQIRRVCRLANRFFTAEEAEAVQMNPERFYEIWAAKESFIKYTGEGLSRPLSDFSVLTMDGLCFTPIPVEGFAACICSKNPVKACAFFVDNAEISSRLDPNSPDAL